MKKLLSILIGFLPVVIFAQELESETTSQAAQSGGSFFTQVVFGGGFLGGLISQAQAGSATQIKNVTNLE